MKPNYQKNQDFDDSKSRIDFSHVFDDVIKQRQQGQNQKLKKKISKKKLSVIYIIIMIISWVIIGFLLFKKENIEGEQIISPDDFIKYLKEHEEI